MSIPNDSNLSKEEKLGYRLIISKISPETLEKIIEGSVTNTLKFVHGSTTDIILSFPVKEIGLGPKNISWSLSQNPQARESLNIIHGIGTKIFILWFFVLFLLIGLFFLYGKVTNSYKFLGGGRLLITNGLFLFTSGLFLNLVLPLASKTFPAQLEPSQALVGILFSSLLPEVGFVWSVLGLIIFIAGISIFLIERKMKQTVIKPAENQQAAAKTVQ